MFVERKDVPELLDIGPSRCLNFREGCDLFGKLLNGHVGIKVEAEAVVFPLRIHRGFGFSKTERKSFKGVSLPHSSRPDFPWTITAGSRYDDGSG